MHHAKKPDEPTDGEKITLLLAKILGALVGIAIAYVGWLIVKNL